MKVLTKDDWFYCSDVDPRISSRYMFNIYGDLKNINTNKYCKRRVGINGDIVVTVSNEEYTNTFLFSIAHCTYILLKCNIIHKNQIPEDIEYHQVLNPILEFLSLDEEDKLRILDISNLSGYIGDDVFDMLNEYYLKNTIDIYIDRYKNVWNILRYPTKYVKENKWRMNVRLRCKNNKVRNISLIHIYKNMFPKEYKSSVTNPRYLSNDSYMEKMKIAKELKSNGVVYSNIAKLLGYKNSQSVRKSMEYYERTHKQKGE